MKQAIAKFEEILYNIDVYTIVNGGGLLSGKVLIIDSDRTVCELLRICLEKEGYAVTVTHDGGEGLFRFSTLKPDIILLDVSLPGIDGWQICREIRKKSEVPLIYITAKSEVFDRVLGLELGADDYILKPFDSREVIARVKAVLRRTEALRPRTDTKDIHYDKLDIDMKRYQLTVNGRVLVTPPREIELLYFLACHPNTVFSRDQLLDEIWGFEYFGSSRTIDVHIKRLREKLNGVSNQWEIKTVWSVGYKFELNEKENNNV